ncbi:nuclear transport factor 2 family protein [Ferrimonas pelagia]|uniref:SnoaL-like domain-containing protein n=1 Tax=Ferrimonas pelagia TaxID=1177826 RepID=A0ABP9EWM6_9GAMM
MDIEHNKQIVTAFFAHFSAADRPAALALLDDKATWQAMGTEGELPIHGVMDKAAIGELIAMVAATFPAKMALTPKGFTAEGDRVALEMESYGVKANGMVYNNPYHFLVTLADGKITALREYMDTLHVKQVFLDDQ